MLTRIDNYFNVFSKTKAFHGIIFKEKSFTITFSCKPCKLVVNLWTFFCSVPKVYNGFKIIPILLSLHLKLKLEGKDAIPVVVNQVTRWTKQSVRYKLVSVWPLNCSFHSIFDYNAQLLQLVQYAMIWGSFLLKKKLIIKCIVSGNGSRQLSFKD